MRRWLKQWMSFPPELEQDFQQDAVKKNSVTLLLLAAAMLPVEAFNIGRVLFFSKSGLTTWNNRFYFIMYLLLLGAALALLVIHRIFRGDVQRLSRVQLCLGGTVLLWNIVLNVYDIHTGHTANSTVAVTALLGLAVLFQARPGYMLTAIVACYIGFMAACLPYLGGGPMLNFTVAAGVAMLASLSHFWYVVNNLKQKRQITCMNDELMREQEKLRISLEQLGVLMEQSSDVMFHWILGQDRVEFSPNWNRLFGYPQKIVGFGSWLGEQRNGDVQLVEQVKQWMKEYAEGKSSGEHEISLRLPSGEKHWYQLRVNMQLDQEGRPLEGVGILRDVTKQQQEIVRLQSRLLLDPLTGIMNKKALEDYMRAQLTMTDWEGMTLLMVDLDDFKGINDTYGHPCGDHVLKETAWCMREIFRESDGVGRLGGDEFGAALPRLRDRHMAEEKARTLIQHVRDIQWEGKPLQVSCSIGGIVLNGHQAADFDTAYQAVDEALYQAKANGKNCWCIVAEVPSEGK